MQDISASRKQGGAPTPSSSPLFLRQALSGKRAPSLGLAVVMHTNRIPMLDGIRHLFASLDASVLSEIEIIVIDMDDNDIPLPMIRHIAGSYNALRLMRAGQDSRNTSEAIFHAWQKSAASILGSIEIGNIEMIKTIPTLLEIAKRKFDTEAIDVISGYQKLSMRWGCIPSRSAIESIVAHLCGKIIMPDLFLASAHPFSTYLLVKREILAGRRWMLRGDIILPNIITHIPEIRIANIQYAYPKQSEVSRQYEQRIALHRLMKALFQLNIIHKTYVLANN